MRVDGVAGRVEEMVMSRHIATVSRSGNFIVWRNVGRRREEGVLWIKN